MSDDDKGGPPSYLVPGTPMAEEPTPVSAPTGVPAQENWVDDTLTTTGTNVIAFKAAPQTEQKCSFCGIPKSQSKGGYFINSKVGAALICVKCVAVCTERLAEDKILGS